MCACSCQRGSCLGGYFGQKDVVNVPVWSQIGPPRLFRASHKQYRDTLHDTATVDIHWLEPLTSTTLQNVYTDWKNCHQSLHRQSGVKKMGEISILGGLSL